MNVDGERKTRKRLLDIPSAAYQAGYSSRHFRRIMDEDRIPVVRIGRKFFIVSSDFEKWQETRGETRLQQALDQIDKWVNESHYYAALHAQAENDD